jgi:hypothetical protein
MEQNWPKEPWRIEISNSEGPDCSQDFVYIRDCGGSHIESIEFPTRCELARMQRIVACVNACAGIHTDDLLGTGPHQKKDADGKIWFDEWIVDRERKLSASVKVGEIARDVAKMRFPNDSPEWMRGYNMAIDDILRMLARGGELMNRSEFQSEVAEIQRSHYEHEPHPGFPWYGQAVRPIMPIKIYGDTPERIIEMLGVADE